MREIVLVSNGPGELYTWARPVLHELRRSLPETRVGISLIPCQFATGNEASIARTFGADAVTTPSQYLRLFATGRIPEGLGGDNGVVLSLGGNANMALTIGSRLGYPTYRYSFEPYWHRKLRKLFVPTPTIERRARRLGAPSSRLEVIGNLVADAVEQAVPAPNRGQPHVLLIPGSRDGFARYLIPFMIGVADGLGARYPGVRLVWPLSRLLSEQTLRDGIAGVEQRVLGGTGGQRQGNSVVTPGGIIIELVPEDQRYAHMRAADLAITIPGTNTLELGIAGVPAVVMLPMNRPELIPLEGIGHWLGMIPLVGPFIKRHAVRLFVEQRLVAFSLPNRFSGEELMTEISGKLTVAQIVEAAGAWLEDEDRRSQTRRRLLETMPRPGAAARLIEGIVNDLASG